MQTLFACLATRAVHLEMTYGHDTDSFQRAFCRMFNRQLRIARRKFKCLIMGKICGSQ